MYTRVVVTMHVQEPRDSSKWADSKHVIPKSSLGSHGVMERTEVDKSRSVNFANAANGYCMPSRDKLLLLASLLLLCCCCCCCCVVVVVVAVAVAVVAVDDVCLVVWLSGCSDGDTTVMMKQTLGSHGIMERVGVDRSGSVTFAHDAAKGCVVVAAAVERCSHTRTPSYSTPTPNT
jgi:hypothetical protein